MVRHRLVQHRPAGPGVGDEDQMAQRLLERPLLVDLLGQRGRGQPAGPLSGLRPQALDGVPQGANVAGRPRLAEPHPFRVPPVQFGADEVGHVDVVHRDVAEVAGNADADQPAVLMVTPLRSQSVNRAPRRSATSNRAPRKRVLPPPSPG